MASRLLKNIGIWGYLIFGVVALLFIFGESLETPGELSAYLVIALTLLPLALMFVLIVKEVSYLKVMFIVLSIILVLLNLTTLFTTDWWNDSLNTNGPVIGIVSLVVSFALALWARVETRLASLLIILIMITPLLTEAIQFGRFHFGGSTSALSVPGILAGLLILLSTLGASGKRSS